MDRRCSGAVVVLWTISACAGAAGVPGQQDTSVFSSTATPSDSTDGEDTDGSTDGSTDGMTSTPSSTADPTDASMTSDPTDADGTDTDAPPPGCGNAIVDPGEDCDLGDANADTGPCKTDCTNQVCGDGFIGPGEGCDDANAVDDDTCSNACVPTSCGDGSINGGGAEQCDDGNGDDGDACPGTCQSAFCGDGFVYAGVETCDTGATTGTCDGDCSAVACGDGFTNAAAGEQCDDGNVDPSDACTAFCLNAFCGDGIVRAGVESCDDGNGNDGDGCSSSCQFEFPDVCEGGNDPGTGSPWVVCAADANSAWVSANSSGNYHPELICQQLGYATVGQWGGTCGNVCGYCEGATSCMATGQQIFDFGAWQGAGNCGADGLGQIMCFTVMWTCVG